MAKKKQSLLTIFLLVIMSAFIFSFGAKIWRPVDFHLIKITVLNACGVDDLAKNTTIFLRRKGFDVIYFGNAAEHLEKTAIVDKLSPEMKWGKIVGKELGVANITTSIDSTRCINVVVLLGGDYDQTLTKKIFNRRLFGF
ncbi:LytR C-terminal domain-containing protein [candidate division WOR-3 bacterium]|nr:LytR C-terminal domain-containing protein [candidate division WOR-3 bacterium]